MQSLTTIINKLITCLFILTLLSIVHSNKYYSPPLEIIAATLHQPDVQPQPIYNLNVEALHLTQQHFIQNIDRVELAQTSTQRTLNTILLLGGLLSMSKDIVQLGNDIIEHCSSYFSSTPEPTPAPEPKIEYHVHPVQNSPLDFLGLAGCLVVLAMTKNENFMPQKSKSLSITTRIIIAVCLGFAAMVTIITI